jgi:DNA primase
VISFIQEQDRVTFWEAVELLARRAGISLEKNGDGQQNRGRALMLDVVRWAAEQYQQCLLGGDDLAAEAGNYLADRGLTGETVRRFGLGYAPLQGDWLVRRATAARVDFELLEKVGLVARSQRGQGFYDRFRDRVMFPIRDAGGRPVGFGGRILPNSPLASRAPKYYNSADSLLFKKSEQLYGLDLARHAAAKAGYLAVVEGYTDVLMAHQHGIGQVVATMGTALNERHVRQLRRFVPRVLLVFDADAGGNTGVDRALEYFVSQDVDLRVATLPEGLDPCDLVSRQGPAALESALTNAVDVLEFKLNQVWSAAASGGIEGQRRAADAILGVIALAPDLTDQAMALKRELMVTRIAHRLGVKEETVWARLKELQKARRPRTETERRPPADAAAAGGRRSARAAAHERELLQVLLADPALVPLARAEVPAGEVEHPGLRQLLEGLYRLQDEGVEPSLDQLRLRIENPRLAAKALEMQTFGRTNPDRHAWLRGICQRFHERRAAPVKQELQNQLHAAGDHATAVELLRQLQNRTGG